MAQYPEHTIKTGNEDFVQMDIEDRMIGLELRTRNGFSEISYARHICSEHGPDNIADHSTIVAAIYTLGKAKGIDVTVVNNRRNIAEPISIDLNGMYKRKDLPIITTAICAVDTLLNAYLDTRSARNHDL